VKPLQLPSIAGTGRPQSGATTGAAPARSRRQRTGTAQQPVQGAETPPATPPPAAQPNMRVPGGLRAQPERYRVE
jgi:hypothetical protein